MKAKLAVAILLSLWAATAYADDFPPGYDLIRDDGTDETRRGVLNLIGAGVSCADDSANNETECTIAGGAGGNSFETLSVPAGTNPVADSSTDTLTITETSFLTITGTAATDTIDITQVTTDLGTDGLIAANAVALTTDTTGNYVADVTAGVGLTKSSSASEGQTVDLAVGAGTAIDVGADTVDFDSTEVEATTWGAGGNASNAWTFAVTGTDPTMTASDGVLTVSAGTTFKVQDDVEIQDDSPHLTWNPTSGDKFGFHVDPGISVAFLNDEDTGARWLELHGTTGNMHLGGTGGTGKIATLTVNTSGTGDGALTVPPNSLSGGELVTALTDRSAGFICPAGLSTDEDCEEVRVYIPSACIVQRVELAVTTAPTGAALIIDVNECSAPGTCTTIDTGTKPQIAISAFSGSDTALTDTTLAAGNYLGIDIDQVGSTVAGSDLTVVVVCRF